MSEDIDSWLIAAAASCQEIEPDMMWSEPLPDNTEDFEQLTSSSFHDFIEYPVSFVSAYLKLEAEFLVSTNPYFKEQAISILQHLDNIDISKSSSISQLLLLSYAISSYPSLLDYIQFEKSPYLLIIWCLGQCINTDIQTVIKYFHEKLFIIDNLPISDQVDCYAFLRLLQVCIDKIEGITFSKPPFATDEFEVIFCLAYCSKKSQAKALAASIVPQMAGLISQSSAAHLLFRRMLPYCSMENRKGQKKALGIIESIVSDYERFLPCISTWISLHRMFL